MRFDAAGARLASTRARWSLDVSLARASRVDARDDGGITAWYQRTALGLEQGFDVPRRPSGTGPYRISVALAGLSARVGDDGSVVDLKDPSGAPRVQIRDLFVRDARGSMVSARFEPDDGGVAIVVDDAHAEYPLHVDPLYASAPERLPCRPSAVGIGGAAVLGDTAFLGGYPNANTLYVRTGTGPWTMRSDDVGFHSKEVHLDGDTAITSSISDVPSEYRRKVDGTWAFETSLSIDPSLPLSARLWMVMSTCALSGDYAACGYSGGETAVVYERTGTVWSRFPQVLEGDAPYEGFGASVAIDGSTLVVSSSSSLYFFTRSGSTWSRQAVLAGSASSLALRGDVLVAGSSVTDSVTAYRRTGTTWSVEASLTPSDAVAGTAYGASVAFAGNVAVVGAAAGPTGAAYVFRRSPLGLWTQQTKLSLTDATLGLYFAATVATDGSTVLVTAPNDPGGAAYVYDLREGGLVAGGACTTGADCSSGFCVDGVCCATACTGTCMACTGAKKGSGLDGTCGPIAAGIDPDAECTGSTCAAGVAQISSCDGAGACQKATASCGSYACNAAGTACVTSCGSPSDCASDATCASGVCVRAVDGGLPKDADLDVIAEASPEATTELTTPPPVAPPPPPTSEGQANGGACVVPSDCASGFCVEGVCCDSACDVNCWSCTVPGHLGACTVEPLGVDLRSQCAPSLSCVATCDGAGGCIAAGQGTVCRRNRCIDGANGVGAAVCSANHGTCDESAAIAFDCSPFACSAPAGACLSSCKTSDHCAPGNVCDTTNGLCVPSSTPPQDSGGCTYGNGSTASGAIALLFVALFALRRRAPWLTAVMAAMMSIACSDRNAAPPPDASAPSPVVSLAARRVHLRANRDKSEIAIDASTVDLRIVRFGRGRARIDTIASDPLQEESRVRFDRGAGVREWYEARDEGIEQGFDLERRLEGDGHLRLELATDGLEPRPRGDAVELVDAGGFVRALYGRLVVRDADGATIPSRLDVVDRKIVIDIDDARARYPLNVDPLVWARQSSELRPSDGEKKEYLSRVVAIDGATAVIGAFKNGDGAAYVFVRDGAGKWSEQAELKVAGVSGVGRQVAVQGDTVVTSDFGGRAHVFVRSGTTWTLQATLTPPWAPFAYAHPVAVDGDTLLVDESVYVRTGTTWSFQADLSGHDLDPDAYHRANHVAVSGDTAIFGEDGGARIFSRVGATWSLAKTIAGTSFSAVSIDGATLAASDYANQTIYVFTRSGTVWSQQAALTAPASVTDTAWGSSVSLKGTNLVVGGAAGAWAHTYSGGAWAYQATLATPSGESWSGTTVAVSGGTAFVEPRLASMSGQADCVHVYAQSGSLWSRTETLRPSIAPGDRFGTSAAIDGDVIALGAPGKSLWAGAAYLFKRATGDSWSESSIAKPADGARDDRFGTSLAMRGGTLVVGAPGRTTGAGGAYVFLVTTDGKATQQAILTTADAASGGEFGKLVDVDGDTAAIQAKNAAYVFVRSGTTWSQQAKLATAGDSIAVSGDTVVIGATTASASGGAVVYVRTGTTWSLQTTLSASGAVSGDQVGAAVAIAGDTALVAARESAPPGKVYVFTRAGTTWTQRTALVPTAPGFYSDPGYSLSLSGSNAFAVTGGQHFLFNGSGASWSPVAIADSTTLSGRCGAIDGDTAVVGSPNNIFTNTYDGSASVFAMRYHTNGDACTAATDCVSRQCVDGVCCDSACANEGVPYACSGCNVPGSVGHCTVLPKGAIGKGPGSSRYRCDGSSMTSLPTSCTTSADCVSSAATCDASGKCVQGLGASCALPSDCASGFCADGVCCSTACDGACDTCNASGACVASSKGATGSPTCAPYVCNGTSTSCPTSCAGAADCAGTGMLCTSGVCTGAASNGAACTSAAACASGFCVDGVCCDQACRGDCVGCTGARKLSGVDGVCGPVAVGATCKPAGCSGAARVRFACNSLQACVATASSCGDYSCDPAKGDCRTHCESVADCAPGFACVSGTCLSPTSDAGPPDAVAETATDATSTLTEPPPVTPPPPSGSSRANGTTCTDAADCSSGFCVEGVCCDTACADTCHSCALPGSPGTCTPEPVGVDLRSQCGPARSCLATCDGKGGCIGASAGTICARNVCADRSHVRGAAVCTGYGGACQTEEAQTFDCAPYACIPAFGACAMSCATSDDCAPGNVCDTSTTPSVCVSPAPADADSSGCSVATHGEGKTGGFVFAALALLMLRRRQRSPRAAH